MTKDRSSFAKLYDYFRAIGRYANRLEQADGDYQMLVKWKQNIDDFHPEDMEDPHSFKQVIEDKNNVVNAHIDDAIQSLEKVNGLLSSMVTTRVDQLNQMCDDTSIMEALGLKPINDKALYGHGHIFYYHPVQRVWYYARVGQDSKEAPARIGSSRLRELVDKISEVWNAQMDHTFKQIEAHVNKKPEEEEQNTADVIEMPKHETLQ